MIINIDFSPILAILIDEVEARCNADGIIFPPHVTFCLHIKLELIPCFNSQVLVSSWVAALANW
ncbi:Uncharacterised protein [Mycobacteroides abscessus subsp. abscessus]|nr:Uncharacterised protein [Mycobacteroides abscessus subsp. abscessus]